MVKLKNNKGGTLLISCLAVMFLTIIAGAYVLCGTTEGKMAHRYNSSSEAFWLADGGLQRALRALALSPVSIPTTSPAVLSETLNTDHNYSVIYYSEPNTQDRWTATSVGTANGITRTVTGDIGKYDIANALTSTGNVAINGNIDINGTVVGNAAFTFESVFNGWGYQDFCNNATHKYPSNINCSTATGTGNNGYNNGSTISGITIVNFDSNQPNLSLNSGSGMVIVDSRSSTNATPTVSVNSNINFSGIIWIIGNATINGNGDIHGAVFVNGNATVGNGNANVTYDAAAINSAVSNFGSTFTSKAPYVLSWGEN